MLPHIINPDRSKNSQSQQGGDPRRGTFHPETMMRGKNQKKKQAEGKEDRDHQRVGGQE